MFCLALASFETIILPAYGMARPNKMNNQQCFGKFSTMASSPQEWIPSMHYQFIICHLYSIYRQTTIV